MLSFFSRLLVKLKRRIVGTFKKGSALITLHRIVLFQLAAPRLAVGAIHGLRRDCVRYRAHWPHLAPLELPLHHWRRHGQGMA